MKHTPTYTDTKREEYLTDALLFDSLADFYTDAAALYLRWGDEDHSLKCADRAIEYRNLSQDYYTLANPRSLTIDSVWADLQVDEEEEEEESDCGCADKPWTCIDCDEAEAHHQWYLSQQDGLRELEALSDEAWTKACLAMDEGIVEKRVKILGIPVYEDDTSYVL